MNPLLHKLQNDPLLFSKKVLGGLEQPWSKQIEIMNSVASNAKTTCRSGQGVGKTWTAARVALWYLFTHTNSLVISTAPSFRQVEEILWSEIRRQYARSSIPLGGHLLQTKLKIDEGYMALGLSTDDPDAFQGFHSEHLLLIIDEAAGVKKPIWEACDSILTSETSKVLAIGNPTDPVSFFAETHKPDSGWNKIRISCLESPNIISGQNLYPKLVGPRWIEDKRKVWHEGSPIWNARVEGEFPIEGTDTVIPLRYIEMALIKELTEAYTEIEVGVDVARFGDDSTVLSARRGPELFAIEKYKKQDTMQTVGYVIQFLKKHSNEPKIVPIKIDTIGIGAGVYDRLSEMGYNVVSIDSSAKASDPEQYVNLRAEMWMSVRERFIEGNIKILNDEELMGELSNVKYKFNAGRYQIESKEEIKKRIGKSPDKADSVVYCYYKSESPRFFSVRRRR